MISFHMSSCEIEVISWIGESKNCFLFTKFMTDGSVIVTETELLRCVTYSFAPSPDPSLTIKFYERTPEQQAFLGYLVDPSQVGGTGDGVSEGDTREAEPHGSVGARAGRRAIAQGNSTEMAEALFRYSAPEEVNYLSEVIFKKNRTLFEVKPTFSFCLNR